MATEISTLELRVKSDEVKDASRSLDDLKDSSDDAEKSTKNLERAATIAGAAIGAGLVAALYKSISAFKEFSSKVSELSAITGASGKDLQFYSDQARLIGETTTLSASEAVEAFKLIASAKPDLLSSKEALAAVTKEAVALAEASGLELPQAANALGNALNQFGASADEASRYINVMAAGSKLGASEIDRTAEALKTAGTVAANAGLSFEETNAAIQAMAAVGIKGGEAGTGLRNVLLRLSTTARDEFNPEVVGLSTALKNLEAAHLTTTQKAKLFGVESIAAANALLKESGTLEDFTDKLTGTSTAYEQAATRTDNLAGDIKRMDSAWADVAITLGAEFNPAMRATVDFITDIAKYVKVSVLEFTDLGDVVGAYAAVVERAVHFDLDGAKSIIAAREEERAALDLKIDKILEAKDAQDGLNDSTKAGATMSLAGMTVQGTAQGGKPETSDSEIFKTAILDLESLRIDAFDSEIARLEYLKEQYQSDADAEIESYMIAQQTIDELRWNKIGTDEELRAIEFEATKQHEERITNIKVGEMRKRFKQESAMASASAGLAAQLSGAIIAYAQATGKEQSGIAKAAFVVSKAAAIAEGYVATELAAIKALVIDPTGTLSMWVRGVGYTSLGLITAASFAGGGGGGGGGTAPSGATGGASDTLQSAFGSQDQQAAQAQRSPDITINVNGSVVGDNLEEIVTNAIKSADKKDYINITVQGQRAKIA